MTDLVTEVKLKELTRTISRLGVDRDLIIHHIRNYRTNLMMFRAVGTDHYLAQALNSYNTLVKELSQYGINVPVCHRVGRNK